MCVLYVFLILAPAGFHMDKTLIVFKRFHMLQHLFHVHQNDPAYGISSTIWVMCSEWRNHNVFWLRRRRALFLFSFRSFCVYHLSLRPTRKIGFRHLLIKVFEDCERFLCFSLNVISRETLLWTHHIRFLLFLFAFFSWLLFASGLQQKSWNIKSKAHSLIFFTEINAFIFY